MISAPIAPRESVNSRVAARTGTAAAASALRASEKTWIYGIAINLIRDHVRREGTAAKAVERAAGTSHEAGAGEAFDRLLAADAIGRALGVLSEEEREAVALRYAADMTLAEIARVTNEKSSTVEGRLYRALRKLRAHLDAETTVS